MGHEFQQNFYRRENFERPYEIHSREMKTTNDH